MPSFFETPVEDLKGIGPQRAALLNKELRIFTCGDLLQYYPFRYEDRTRFYTVSEVKDDMPFIQFRGSISVAGFAGHGYKKRLTATFSDKTGSIELVWFQGANWILGKIKPGVEYIVFGRPNRFGGRYSIAHPEFEPSTAQSGEGTLRPVYSLTETLRRRNLDSRLLGRLLKEVIEKSAGKIRETLPEGLLRKEKFIGKQEAVTQIHFPSLQNELGEARRRLKFEELFYIQLRLLTLKLVRRAKFTGMTFQDARLVTEFYNRHLPFQLTGAQKRVIKEIYADLKSGKQMNRLLQGDVGSGKTIVSFICKLVEVGGGAQAALMAPTEILAQQHFANLKKLADPMRIRIELLTGSTKKSARRPIHEALREGSLQILVGTHALIEEEVQFNKLGLAVIDEQHRFGVAQRSKLWQKNPEVYPHVLVMTATPIPRTLALTLYGDLEVSTIDELPPGRKPIKTIHRYDSNRLQVQGFLRQQLDEGRQIYFVYPLIEESEKMDLKHLMDGYESICRAFPDVAVSIVHGKMKSEAKAWEMRRFVKGETKIMVATTVIEVGVDVPNASVMVVENAERFGLSQLHQLRGRVGRGADQSFCLLITDVKLSAESRERIKTLVRTNDGFEIAEADLEMRGPGDLMGTQQSGVLDLLIADLGQDGNLLQQAREAALAVLEYDPELAMPENRVIRQQIDSARKSAVNWSRIS